MLTIFLLPSNESDADPNKMRSSVKGEYPVIEAPNVEAVNKAEKKSEWFGVFYDNEFLDEQLLEALPEFLASVSFDVYVLFKYLKDDQKAVFGPRIYRSYLHIKQDLDPEHIELLRKEKVLNGWIRTESSTVVVQRTSG